MPGSDPRVLAWQGHSEGQQAIFLARGPQAFVSGAAHQLFADSRVNMAILAIGKRTRSPFHSPQWMTIPWSLTPKTTMDNLMDLMLELPRVLEQVSQIRAVQGISNPAVVDLRERVLTQCQVLETNLALWAKYLGTDIFRFDYTIQSLPLTNPKNDAEFALLHLCNVYWFTQMVVSSVKSYVATPGEAIALEAIDRLHSWASRSAYSIPLMFQTGGGMAENMTGLLVLSIALRYYITTEPAIQRSKEAECLEELLEQEMAGTLIHKLIQHLFNGKNPFMRKNIGVVQATDRVAWF